jgi:hypothetical protein
MHAPAVTAAATTTGRDLRLDLFRGIALWLIFLDHIPSNLIAWGTIRNYGFSDATEIFVFVSGYTAAFVYGKEMRERGFVIAGAHILRRAWQIYVAHVFLFAIYLAEISYVATSFENPLYAEEMNILDFLKQPDVTIVEALLKFKPSNMDVLPLYIILLLLFPPTLWLLQFRSTLALGASVLLYVLTWQFNWNMPSYPSGHWYFNPFAWQLLFVFGAWCALGGAQRLSRVLQSPVTLSLAAAYLLFAFVISLTWYLPGMGPYVPHWLEEVIYPIDKVNLDVLRFAHFLALAVLAVRFVPREWPLLKSWWAWPLIVCGQHSLEIFCLGVFLSFAAHFAMVEISGSFWMQLLVSVLGIVIMVAAAAVLRWYKRAEGRSSGSRPKKTPDADLAGGEA